MYVEDTKHTRPPLKAVYKFIYSLRSEHRSTVATVVIGNIISRYVPAIYWKKMHFYLRDKWLIFEFPILNPFVIYTVKRANFEIYVFYNDL